MSKVSISLLLAVLLSINAAAVAQEEGEREEIKPALLVIDVQNIWMPLMAQEDRDSAPAKINEAIALFREFGHPVIVVYHTDPERGPEPGTEPFEFPVSIAIEKTDPRVVKNYPSAFTGTDLDSILRETGRNTVILCGLSATGCVLATYYGAIDRKYICLMVQDALLSGNADYTNVIEDICYSMTIEELRELLEDPYH